MHDAVSMLSVKIFGNFRLFLTITLDTSKRQITLLLIFKYFNMQQTIQFLSLLSLSHFLSNRYNVPADLSCRLKSAHHFSVDD